MAKSYIDQGLLVPDQVTTDMLIEELKKQGYAFVTIPELLELQPYEK